jgi:hypothetical protein
MSCRCSSPTLIFLLMYRLLPDVRLSWRDVRTGALVTTVLFVIGKSLIGLYLGRSATDLDVRGGRVAGDPADLDLLLGADLLPRGRVHVCLRAGSYGSGGHPVEEAQKAQAAPVADAAPRRRGGVAREPIGTQSPAAEMMRGGELAAQTHPGGAPYRSGRIPHMAARTRRPALVGRHRGCRRPRGAPWCDAVFSAAGATATVPERRRLARPSERRAASGRRDHTGVDLHRREAATRATSSRPAPPLLASVHLVRGGSTGGEVFRDAARRLVASSSIPQPGVGAAFLASSRVPGRNLRRSGRGGPQSSTSVVARRARVRPPAWPRTPGVDRLAVAARSPWRSPPSWRIRSYPR